MKYVQVEEDIQIMADGEKLKEAGGKVMKPWSFSRYLEDVVLANPTMGAGYKSVNSCAIMEKQFKEASPGSWVPVEDEHWNMLKNAVEEPKGIGVHPVILRQLLPFTKAILEAKDEKPNESG